MIDKILQDDLKTNKYKRTLEELREEASDFTYSKLMSKKNLITFLQEFYKETLEDQHNDDLEAEYQLRFNKKIRIKETA